MRREPPIDPSPAPQDSPAEPDEDLRTRHRLERELAALRDELAQAREELSRSRAREDHAHHASFHDGLTGLPNRSAFEERARHALALHSPDCRPFGLLYIDLDGFKAVNDAHGHAVGDELLRIIGIRLARTVRAEDLVCRYGGDEFLVLMLDVTDEAQAASIARKLAVLVAATCIIGSVELRVEPSIGIAIYPRDGTTIASLLDRADGAMFRAKRHRSGHAFSRVPSPPGGGDAPAPDAVAGG